MEGEGTWYTYLAKLGGEFELEEGGGDLVYSFTYFTDDAGKVSWGQGIILAEKDSNTDERVADDSAHIVKHVHRNCKVLYKCKSTTVKSTDTVYRCTYSSEEIASGQS